MNLASVIPAIHPASFLADGGETGALMRALDWSKTPLGHPAAWPIALQTLVGVMLGSRQPMLIVWGEEHTTLYNDGYAVMCGARHPAALGRPFDELWFDIWDTVGPILARTYAGEATHMDDLHLTMHRNGYPEETHFAFSYTPVNDASGKVAGMFCACTETTKQVIAERNLIAEKERLREMFAQSPSFMALLEGADHRFTLANRGYLKLIGGRELVGKPIREALPEVEGQGYFELLDEVFRTGRPAVRDRSVVRLQTEHGVIEERFVDFILQPISDSGGVTTGIFMNGYDVTERVRGEEESASEFRARRRAELELRESHDQLRLAQAAGETGVFSIDIETAILTVTPELCRLFGLAPVESMPVGVVEKLILKDDRTVLPTRDGRARGEAELNVEYRIARADTGEVRWISRRAEYVRDAAGKPVQMLGVVQDITGRRLAAETLRDSEAQFAILAQAMPNQVWTATPDGKLDWLNERVVSYSGLPESELLGDGWVQMVHREDQPSAGETWMRSLGNGERYETEFRLRRSDGAWRWHIARAVPIFTEGAIRKWIGTNTDIHDQMTAQEELAALNASLEERVDERTRELDRLWTNSQDLLAVLDSAGHFRAVNPAWERVLGFHPFEIIGRNVKDMVVQDDTAATLDALDTATAGALSNFENRYRHKDGGIRWISWTASPDDYGMVYANGRHITAEKEAKVALRELEEQLRQSQKMEAIGQLTGGIAHDFNNLLTGIIGSLDLMRRRMAAGRTEGLDRFMDAATTSANRAAALTHRLLAFARRQSLDAKPVQINQLIAGMTELLARTLGEQVELEFKLHADAWSAVADPNQLENALLNLAINARDAMPDGGKLTIETNNTSLDESYTYRHQGLEPGEYVVICVTDTGSGMSEATIARAFEPFFTTKPLGQGTGLGLSMIYGFAKQSGGHVKIESELGQGTTVKLYLPRVLAETAEPVSTAGIATLQQGDGESVLVVEDDPSVRLLVVEVLRELGYAAIEAHDGTSALPILQSSRRIDLLVSDVGLPGINGRQLAEMAREARPGLKVLFITGYAAEATVRAGFLGEEMEMITKPFALDHLAAKIREMLTAKVE